MLSHLLEVIKELQGDREPFSDQTAALRPASHEPVEETQRRYPGVTNDWDRTPDGRGPERSDARTMGGTRDLLYTVDPGHKLEGGAGGGVTLGVGLWDAVYCVEHHQAILGTSILRVGDEETTGWLLAVC